MEYHPMIKNKKEVLLLLFAKIDTAHTGDVPHKMTRKPFPKL